MKEYKPFDTNQSISIGDLTLENSEDKIVLYGDLEISRDKLGLENLNTLLEVLIAAKKQLEKENLPERIQNKQSFTIENPFKNK